MSVLGATTPNCVPQLRTELVLPREPKLVCARFRNAGDSPCRRFPMASLPPDVQSSAPDRRAEAEWFLQRQLSVHGLP